MEVWEMNLFGGTGADHEMRREMHRSGVEVAASIGGIVLLLVEKGIVTDGEVTAAKARVMALLDQEIAARRDAEIKALSPVERALFDLAQMAGFGAQT